MQGALAMMMLMAATLAVGAELVTVEVFIESFCPCSGTWQAQFEDAIVPKVGSIVDLKRSFDGAPRGTNDTACFHGKKECEANALQACVQARTEWREWLNFTTCINGPCKHVGCPDQYKVASDEAVARETECAGRVGLKWAEISACYQGAEGKALIRKDAEYDQKVKEEYGLKGLPVVFVDGKLFSKFWDCDSFESAYHTALIAAICQAYTGTAKPPACSA